MGGGVKNEKKNVNIFPLLISNYLKKWEKITQIKCSINISLDSQELLKMGRKNFDSLAWYSKNFDNGSPPQMYIQVSS